MQILLVAATKIEIEPFIAANREIDFIVSGVGVPATMYHLQKKLEQQQYDFVVQAGIAGTFDPTIPLGQPVIVQQDTFADIGMEEKEQFTSIFQSGFIDPNEFPYKNGWLNNPMPLIEKFHLPVVKSVTVNKVSDSYRQRQQLEQYFDPQAESMEGAALHYVCLRENIAFLQLRSISNMVGERDKGLWKLRTAIENLNIALTGIISELQKQYAAANGNSTIL